ncbi:MAG: hypothetical protein AAF456_20395 [Planctomycetota bacterium]
MCHKLTTFVTFFALCLLVTAQSANATDNGSGTRIDWEAGIVTVSELDRWERENGWLVGEYYWMPWGDITTRGWGRRELPPELRNTDFNQHGSQAEYFTSFKRGPWNGAFGR